MLTIAGVGPGNPKYLTLEVAEKIKNADKIIVFNRVGKSIESIRDDYIVVGRVDEIVNLLEKNKDILLLASGDPCFYGIVDYIKRKGIIINEVLPGLSSFQYMMAKLQKSWQSANFLSLHGREDDLKKVKDNNLTIVLIDKDKNPSYISKMLDKLGIKGTMYIGFNLSYSDEKFIVGNIGEEFEDYSSLGVVVIENEMD